MPIGTDWEIPRLQAALRDLVALFSIPAVWVDREPSVVAEGLADTLVELSELDFVFVRLRDPTGAGEVDAMRGDAWHEFPEWLERQLAMRARLSSKEIVPDVGDSEPYRGLVVPIGVDAAGGLVAAASSRGAFPDELDQLLVPMAANHAAAAFQNACLIHERGRAEQRLRATRDELANVQAALRQVATLAARESSPERLFAVVAEQVARIFDVPFVRLVGYEPDGSVVLGGFSEGDDNPFPVGSRWPLDSPGVIASVRQSGRPARVDDYAGVPRPVAAAVRRSGMRSAVASPIVVEGHPWGAMVLLCSRREPLPEDTEARLTDFTELVATAIANAESRRELEQVVAEQQALRRAATLVASGASPTEVFDTITASASELFDVPFASLLRFRADETATMVAGCAACSAYVGQTWTVPSDDPGIVRTVVRSSRPARIEDHSGVHGPLGEAARSLGIGSVVGVPVIVDGSVWGILAVGAALDGPPLPLDASDRLVGFTELVSTAIANSDAREKVERLLEEQAALRRVATLVARGRDPEELFSAVSDEVARLFASDGAGIGRFEPDGSGVVVVGLSEGLGRIPIGTRTELDGSLASSEVYRTGRVARKELSGEGIDAPGPIADTLRGMRFYSTVAAPIVVEGSLWGVLMTLSARESLPPDTEERLEKFGGLVATAIANAESRGELAAAEARARELADEQAALRRVATLVARGVSPDDLFVAVCDEVARLVNAEITTIGRFDRHEPYDMTVVGLSSGYRGISIGTRSPQMDWLASSVVYRTGRTARRDVTAAQITDSHPVADSVRAMGFFSTVSAPIVVEGELWGVVTASSSNASLPLSTEKRVESFGELVATALANADSRAELAASEARARALAEEQAALRRVATLLAGGAAPAEFFSAVAREVAAVLNVPGVIVTRYEADGMAVVFGDAFHSELSGAEAFFGVGSRAPADPGSLAAQVLETHGTGRIDDFAALVGTVGDAARAAGFGSGCAGAIVVDGKLWGKMCVFSAAGTVLPHGTEDRLHDFVELVATAIANYEARAELAASESRAHELANEQAALRRVATLVARGADPDALFSAVAKEVAGIIDIPIIRVNRFEADGTFTMVGIAGETNFTVGSRWPVQEDGLAGMILTTGRPARKDDYSMMRGPLGDALREDTTTSTVGVPIVVEGSIWGFMVAAGRPGRPIPPGTEDRLHRFTELVATAVSNATTRTDLLTSRARLVSAADETRRRVERDLHDGIQQLLVALALKARKAASLSGAGESAVKELSGLADDLVTVTDELREISRGIHPAILSDAGLDDALAALARRSAIRVDLEVHFQRRYDPTLEATVYYVVAESITNAVKHGQASSVEVRGGLRDDELELEIKDDGVGGADPRRGTGMIGLKDRVDTLGGTISFASPAGAGTTIRVSLPTRPGDGDDLLSERSDEAASAPASG
jgi:GAF domain-containing protein